MTITPTPVAETAGAQDDRYKLQLLAITLLAISLSLAIVLACLVYGARAS